MFEDTLPVRFNRACALTHAIIRVAASFFSRVHPESVLRVGEVTTCSAFARMLGTEMTRKYYLISDLHMGGDGQLQHCDYAAEFMAFLKGLEKEGPETELLIIGDTFGFWQGYRI